MLSLCKNTFSRFRPSDLTKRFLYVQGQEPEPKIREYFYYIDHQGMLFLDDARMKNFTSCFKEKKFLQFFFKRIKLNDTGRYQNEFPFVSLCGRERNYIRCDDVPVVYTHITNQNGTEYLTYGAEMLMTFDPERLYMFPETGRVYHPAEEQYGSIGLVRSVLAIELSRYFLFANGEYAMPTHFLWNNKKNELDKDWFKEAIKKHNLKIRAHS